MLMDVFSKQAKECKNWSIRDISSYTAIKVEDIISTLQSLDMIRYWKGQHVVYVRNPSVEEYIKNRKRIRLCDNQYLSWIPHSERKKGIAGNSSEDHTSLDASLK
mmetsp:Transcript_14382/g.14583  ORF Transcript_14382/g.14583 Transcript_14382/m.14583 type:complete len:105 (-) Transcript_14382:309-623(-)